MSNTPNFEPLKVDLPLPEEQSSEKKHFLPQSNGEFLERTADAIKDRLGEAKQDAEVWKPLEAKAQQWAAKVAEKAPEIAASQSDIIADAAVKISQAAPALVDGAHLASGAMADLEVLKLTGYAAYQGTSWVDEHTNHSITQSAPAQAWGTAQERSGIDERLFYAEQAKDSYDTAHKEGWQAPKGLGWAKEYVDEARSDLAWAKAAVDPNMRENHAQSLQQTINTALDVAHKSFAQVSLAESHQILNALDQANAGDKLEIDAKGNVSLVSGTSGHPHPEPGVTTLDAQALRLAANIRYEAPSAPKGATEGAAQHLAASEGPNMER